MRSHRPLALASVVAVAAFVLFAAGCGRGGSPRVASVATSATTTTTTAQGGLVAFSHCMRTHGVPNYPDPHRYSQGNMPTLSNQDLGVSKQTAVAAQQPCERLFPDAGSAPRETAQQQRTLLADALSFARCMRSHGLTRFPDPTAQAGLTVEVAQAAGIDLHSPAVLRVAQECVPASHGGLTMAKFRESIQNAGG